ncbi:MAG: GDP-mannose 4,6-dehydratase [Ginsengibacter sp.]
MTALIIGANGQDGFYLNKLLHENQIEVIGVSRHGNFLHTDISSFEEISKLIKQTKPEYIFHLAANSTTAHYALFDNHDAISTSSINILEAVKQFSPSSKVFLSGSGLQFLNNGNPIKETDEFAPTSAYAVARIHSVYAARYYRSLGIKTYIGYFFNHESPRRTPRHISKMIGDAVKSISKGSEEKISIGDMSVKKEWTFAGDVVKGIWTLVNQESIFESVIGSGKGYSIADYLDECFALIGKNKVDFVIPKNDFTPEYKALISDPSTLISLGWTPEISLQELAKMMVQS